MLYTEWIPAKQTGSICRQHELPSTAQYNTEQNITEHDSTRQNISYCLQVLPEHLKLTFETRHKPQKITYDSTAYHTAAQNST